MREFLDRIRQQCPLLSQPLDQGGLLAKLEGLPTACEARTLESLVDTAFVILETVGEATEKAADKSDARDKRFCLAHAPLVQQVLHHSAVVWMPWDERRPDRVQQLQQRIEHNASQWRQLRFDGRCVADLCEWLWQGERQTLPFPVGALVRLEDLIGRSLRSVDVSGSLVEVAQQLVAQGGQPQTPLLRFVSMLERLRAELQILRSAALEAGLMLPALADVQPPKPLMRRDDFIASIPQALFANPDPLADAEQIGLYLTRRDSSISWRDWKGLEKLLVASGDLFRSEAGQFTKLLALGLLCGPGLLDSPGDALKHLGAALQLRPQSLDALTAQANILAAIPDTAPADLQQDRWQRWLVNANARLDLLTDAHDVFALKLERALVVLHHTSDLDAALGALKTLSDQASPNERATLHATLAQVLLQNAQSPNAQSPNAQAPNALPPSAATALLVLLDTPDATPQRLAPLYTAIHTRADFASLPPATRAPLLRRLADLQLMLDQRPQAFDTLRAALDLSNPQEDGDFVEYFSKYTEAFDTLASELGRQPEALESLSALHTTYPDHPLITQRFAQALLTANQPERALPPLEDLQRQAPDDTQTTMLLIEAYRACDRLGLAIDALERLQRLLGASDEAAALDDVLQVLREELSTTPAAALDYHRARIHRDPAHGPTRDALRQLIAPATPPAIALAAFEALGTPPIPPAAFLADCQAILSVALTPAHAPLARALAAALARPPITRPDLAATAYTTLWTLSPGDAGALIALKSLHKSLRAWSSLVSLLLEAANLSPDPDAADSLRLEATQTLADELDDLQAAYTVLQSILQRRPNFEPARRSYDILLSRNQPVAGMIDVLTLAEDDTPPDSDAWIALRLRRAALVASTQDPQALPNAISLLRQASQRAPENDLVWSRLEDLLRAHQQYDDVALVLLQRLTLAQTDAQIQAIQQALAWLLEHHPLTPDIKEAVIATIPDPDTSDRRADSPENLRTSEELRTYEDLPATFDDRPATSPRTPPLHPTDNSAAILKALQSRITTSQGKPLDQIQALDDLASFHLRRNDPAAATDALTRALQLQSSPDTRANLLSRLSLTSETRGDLDAAEKHLKLALAALPSRLSTTDLLLAFYRRHNMHAKLLRTLQFRINKTPPADLPLKLALLAELANVAQTNLDDEDTAISALQDMVSLLSNLSPTDLPPGADPLLVHRNLATLLARQGDTDLAIACLDTLLTSPRFPFAPPPDRADALTDYAALLLSANRTSDAQTAIQQALSLSPENPRARLLQIDLLCLQNLWNEAASQAEAALDSTPQAHLPPLLARLGKVYAAQQQRDKASLVYQQLLDLSPDHPDALAFLNP